jgi:hypothetical protein
MIRSSTLSSFNDPFEGQVFTLRDGFSPGKLVDEIVRQLEEMETTGEKTPIPDGDLKHQSPIGMLVALYHNGHLGSLSLRDFQLLLFEKLSAFRYEINPSSFAQRAYLRLADSIYAICFTANDQSLLMWSHYADHHKGAILTFDSDNVPSILDRAKPVRYITDFPQDDNLIETVTSHLKRAFDGESLIERTLLTKSQEWSYEQEYRVIVPVTDRNEDGLVVVPPESLVSVVLGCRMSKTERAELAQAALKTFPNVLVRNAVRSVKGFRLDYADYKETPNI